MQIVRSTIACAIAAMLMTQTGTGHGTTFVPRPLTYGSQGSAVTELQGRLQLLGQFRGAVDGQFGWNTLWAVRRFQYDFGLHVTGKADSTTMQKLVTVTRAWHPTPGPAQTAASSASSAATKPVDLSPATTHGLSHADLALMSRAVFGEARGEPFRGQVAIAAVILNRLRDPRFPHSVSGIVYQPGAFTAVRDGQMSLSPNAQALQAVMEAIQGADPANGAVYYYNPATATSRWIWSRPKIITIGHHVFCK